MRQGQLYLHRLQCIDAVVGDVPFVSRLPRRPPYVGTNGLS